jgi:flavin reductase (DIM6/NTAB) family NADH-FMN oxidoreductase RutF
MLLMAAWAGICCSSPPRVAVSLRKATYTYGNIMERKAFTISLPSEDYVEKIRPILFSPEGRKYHGVGRLLGKAFSMGKEV